MESDGAFDEYEALQHATKDSTPKHQITGRLTGKVIDAYDGDTCRVAISLPTAHGAPRVEYLQVRMLGYDAPEMKKTKGLDHRPYGEEVRAVFHALVLDKIVIVDIPAPDKPDPYGRVLAHLYVAERGSQLRVPYYPTPPTGCAAAWYALCCCFPCSPCQPPTAGMMSVAMSDTASSTAGTESKTVRDREVRVPITVDVPNGYKTDDASLASLIHVNQWMIDHARVKAYAGEGARPEWTAEELRDGV